MLNEAVTQISGENKGTPDMKEAGTEPGYHTKACLKQKEEGCISVSLVYKTGKKRTRA